MRKIVLIFLCICSARNIIAQSCNGLGQYPSSAFPVCGFQSFSQATVPLCGGVPIPGACKDGGESDINPFWYKFTCYQSGTLGFVITPTDLTDDYDWQIFDVTGHPVNDVYTKASLFVVCNWSGNPGLTGAKGGGVGLVNCGGFAYPTFSAMPNLIKDHQYLMLISHFTPTQSGYKLDFGGGSALIYDTTKPALANINVICGGAQIGIKLNKKMQCISLDADGSDFNISNAPGKIISADAITCKSGFDMDSINLTLNSPLAPGNYTLSIKKGADGNTLSDACGLPMDAGNSINFTILPPHPPILDSITFPKCPPDILVLNFDQVIQCETADINGSDFKITGPSNVNITSVTSECDVNGGTSKLYLHLSAPIVVVGNYSLQILKGIDNNTLISFCGDELLPVTQSFYVPPAVSANFEYKISGTCTSDTLTFINNGGSSILTWIWTANGKYFGNASTVIKSFPTDSTYHVRLIVSNGGCTDIKDSIIPLLRIKAIFNNTDAVCPGDSVSINNLSEGPIQSYLWNFGNGNGSMQKYPSYQTYPYLAKEHIYKISLTISGPGCIDSVSHPVRVLSNCFIDVPNSFTPNNDGVNDYFYPLNALKADHLNFLVYNKWGMKVFESHEWTKKWDGTYKGQPQEAGVYVYIFNYTNKDTGKNIYKKGTVMLIR